MPRLLVFVPCLKSIFDQDDDSISLISLLQRITVTRPPGGIPPDAVTAHEWSLFALWLREPEDEGKEFQEAYEILRPDGTPFLQVPTRPFTMTTQSYRSGGNVHGFPVGQEGEYSLRLGMKEISGKAGFSVYASYPIYVRHVDQGGRPYTESTLPGESPQTSST